MRFFSDLKNHLLKDSLSLFGLFSIILFGIICSLPGDFFNSKTTVGFLNKEVSQKEKNFLVPNNQVRESPELCLLQKNTLVASVPPIMVTPQILGAIAGLSDLEETRKEIFEHVVQPGENLWSISKKYQISIDTILWANDIKTSLIKPGQKLLILPVSGVMHLVKKGDTVDSLAKKYETKPEKIISFNNLSDSMDLFEGEVLVIPDGKMPFKSEIKSVKSSSLVGLSTNDFYGKSHRYPYGQCTWWVAQKRAIPSWGNAKDWLDRAIISGFPVCKGRYCIPKKGAVISLGGHPLGHVGYVEETRGNWVKFSEMNYIGWGRMDYRVLPIGHPSIRGYIY